ncbi:MAG: hypothetical protein R2769_04340 [Saprospiraceae bacterium]
MVVKTTVWYLNPDEIFQGWMTRRQNGNHRCRIDVFDESVKWSNTADFDEKEQEFRDLKMVRSFSF